MIGLPSTLPTLNKAGYNDQSYAGYKQQDTPAYPNTVGREGNPATMLGNSYTTSGPAGNQNDHPIRSATGQWVSSTTGQAWHGTYQNPNGSTQYYSNGQQVSDVGQVGNQMPNISIQTLQKNPALSGQVADAVAANTTNTQLLSKPFNQYLDEAHQLAQQGAVNLARDQAAINPSGTISTMNRTTGQSVGTADAALGNYVAGQNKVQSDIAAENQDYQNTQNKNFTNFGNALTQDNANYAAAAQKVADLGYANALKQSNLYQLGTGTPTSGSGEMSNRYIADYNSINIPLQADLANRQLQQTNQLYGIGSQLQNQYYGNLQNQFAGQGQQNTATLGATNQTNQYTTGLQQDTAKYIQSLQQSVAGMSNSMAAQYLQQLGIPIQTAQAIISGNTQNLMGLTNLDQLANTYNFVTPYQSNAPGASVPRINYPSVGNNTGTANNYGPSLAQLVGQSPYAYQQPYTTTVQPQTSNPAPATNTPTANSYFHDGTPAGYSNWNTGNYTPSY